ncbi:MAG: DUF4179 domain-containing protein [Oscillospiraceae bacterium]|nr:DUF4179 domain-containing protein [Oscillospiraceae bacterium]
MNTCVYSTNAELLFQAIDVTGGKYLLEATDYRTTRRKSIHKRLLIAAVAAIISVLMVGAGFVSRGYSIADWFSNRWESETGNEMTETQYDTIKSMTQYIGMSDTIGGVTITVDSATVTDSQIYALLKVEGSESDYPLRGYTAYIKSKSTESGVSTKTYEGKDEDGAAYYILNYSFDYIGDPEDEEMDIILRVEETEDKTSNYWEFRFTLNRTPDSHIDLVPYGESIFVNISMSDHVSSILSSSSKETTRLLTREIIAIELSETCMKVTYDNSSGSQYTDIIYSDLFMVYAIMQDGSTVGLSSRSYHPIPFAYTSTVEYYWQLPINLDELAYIRIGYTDIPVNPVESELSGSELSITLESAKAGDSDIYLLLRIEGIDLSSGNISFGDSQLSIDRATLSYIDYLSLEGDDDAYYLLLYGEYGASDMEAEALDCVLELGTLHTDYLEDDDIVISDRWEFEFTVEHGSVDSVSLVTDAPGISDLVITEYGCTFTYDFTISPVSWAPTDVTIVTKSGREIHTAISDIEYIHKEINDIYRVVTGYRTFLWEKAIDLDEVNYIYFTDGLETDGVIVRVQ